MKSYAIEPPISDNPLAAARALADAIEHLPGLGLVFGGVTIARGRFVLSVEGELERKQETHLRLKPE